MMDSAGSGARFLNGNENGDSNMILLRKTNWMERSLSHVEISLCRRGHPATHDLLMSATVSPVCQLLLVVVEFHFV